jgi:hypothetical protein
MKMKVPLVMEVETIFSAIFINRSTVYRPAAKLAKATICFKSEKGNF